MNKKGMTMSIIMKFVLLSAVVIIVLIITQSNLFGAEKTTNQIMKSTSKDYDNDQLKDFSDKSPCITGAETVIDRDDRQTYYYSHDAESDTDTCGKPFVSKTGKTYNWLLKHDSLANNQAVCVLDPDDCHEALQEWYAKQEEQE